MNPPVDEERAAWGTIRGFFTQVLLTAIRWVDLGEAEIIVCEGKEDIDRYIIDEDGAFLEPSYEQVKDYSGNLSIRNASVRETIAQFAVAFQTHAENGTTPVCRFTTTSGRARQQISGAGVDVLREWEEWARQTPDERESAPLVASLRKQLSDEEIDEVLDWLDEHEDRWAGFLDAVEFVFEVGSVPKLLKQLNDRLCGDNRTDLPADLLAARIVRTVFEAASQRDVTDRVLTSRALVQLLQLAEDGLEEWARDAEAERLRNWTTEIVVRLDGLEREFRRHREDVEERIQELESTDALLVGFQIGSLDPPMLPAQIAPRAERVEQVATQLDDSAMVLIAGEVGFGKSQLASLIVEDVGRTAVWLNLHNTSSVNVEPGLAALASALGAEAAHGRQAYAEALDGRDDMVIVLDEIPEISPIVADKLAIFVAVAEDSGVAVIGTTAFEPSSRLLEVLGRRLAVFDDLDFTNEEIRELCSAHGAPDGLPDELFDIIASGTSRCATLVKACVVFLESIGWDFLSDEGINGILGQQFAATTQVDTIRKLIASVDDEKACELLYRLTVPMGAVPWPLVKRLSEIDEPVPHPRQTILPLVGAWVRPEGDDSYRVSPLIRPMGEDNLTEEAYREANRRSAEFLFRTGILEHRYATQAILHLHLADEYDRSGALYLSQLDHLSEYEGLTSDMMPSLPWVGEQLPVEMNSTLRLGIRLKQLLLLPRVGRDTNPVERHLEALLPDLREADFPLLVFLKILQNTEAVSIDVDQAFYRLLDGILDGEADALPAEVQEATTLATLQDVESGEELSKWLHTLERFGFPLDETPVTAEVMRLAVWRVGAEVGDEHVEIANRTNIASVRHAVRARAILNMNEPMAALEKEPSEVQFLVLGELAFDSGDTENARDLFQRAVTLDAGRFEGERLWTLHGYAALLAADGDWDRALKMCASARDAAKAHGEPLKRFNAAAEEAIGLYLAGEHAAAAERLVYAADLLWSNRDSSDPLWRRAFVVFGHVTGYIWSMLNTGQPPYEGEPYVGVFQCADMKAANLFDERRCVYVPAHIAGILAQVGDHRPLVKKWRTRVYEIGVEFDREELIFSAGVDEVANRLSASPVELSEAIEGAHRFGRAAAKMRRATTRQLDFTSNPEVFQEMELSDDERSEAELYFYGVGLIPAAMRIGIRRLGELEVIARGFDFDTTDELSHIVRLSQAGRARELIETDWAHEGLNCLAYILASKTHLVPLETCFEGQVFALTWMAPSFGGRSAILLDVVEPFIADYWKDCIENRRIGFTAPGRVACAVETALSQQDGHQWQAVLRAVELGLRVSVPDHVRLVYSSDDANSAS